MAIVSTSASSDFLTAQPGDIVVVELESSIDQQEVLDFWIGHVIHVVGSARNSAINSLFQIVDFDTGIIKTINADLVKGILRPKS